MKLSLFLFCSAAKAAGSKSAAELRLAPVDTKASPSSSEPPLFAATSSRRFSKESVRLLKS